MSSPIIVALDMGPKSALELVNELDGVFAFALYNIEKKFIHVARDPFGIRSLYIGKTDNSIGVASEMKSLHEIKSLQSF